MAYKVKMLVSGLNKNDIVENGHIVSKKLWKNDIVEVQEIDESELKAGYYKVVTKNIVSPTPTIKRSRQPSSPIVNQQIETLNTLINTMKQMTDVAEKTLNTVQATQTKDEQQIKNEEVVEPKVDEPVQEDKKPVILNQHGDVSDEYKINEDEVNEEIYTIEEFKKGNQLYQSVLKNTLANNMRSGVNTKRYIEDCKIGDISKKKMPAASEVNLGKITGQKIDIIIPKKELKPINIIKDKNGKVDKVKSLGLNMVNQPNQGFNI